MPFLKKYNILFGIIFLLALFIPETAEGVVWGAAQTALAGLAEKTGPIAAFLFASVIIFWLCYGFLFITSSLLQGVIEATPELLTLSGSGMGNVVQAGWNFTAGITNMILILAFVFIAVATILGFESYGAKKALPKFIGVALLINFTLVFVGVGIDISNFLWHALSEFFVGEDASALHEGITPLLDVGSTIWTTIVIFLGTLAATLAIPYLNVVIQIGWLLSIPFILGYFFEFLIFGMIMLLISGVFFVFFFVLFARIFIIQILAIIAPLAFLCLIFDSTKKWFYKWLDHLVQWLLVGVAFLFFMYIGLRMAPHAQTMGRHVGRALDELAVPSWLQFLARDIDAIVSYIALLLYFMIILGVCYKLIPAAAQATIGQVSGVIKATSPYLKAAGKGGLKKASAVRRETREFGKKWEEKGFSQAASESVRRGFEEHPAAKLYRRTKHRHEKEISKTQEEINAEKYQGGGADKYAEGLEEHKLNTRSGSLIALQAAKEGKLGDVGDILGKDAQGNDRLNTEVDVRVMKEMADTHNLGKPMMKNLPTHYVRGGGSVNDFQGLRPSAITEDFTKEIGKGLESTNEEIRRMSQNIVDSLSRSENPDLFKNLVRHSKGETEFNAARDSLVRLDNTQLQRLEKSFGRNRDILGIREILNNRRNQPEEDN